MSDAAMLTDDRIRRLRSWAEDVARRRYVPGNESLIAVCDEVLRLRAEVRRLNDVLRHTHEHYCSEDYTIRGRHAPECLLYELDDE